MNSHHRSRRPRNHQAARLRHGQHSESGPSPSSPLETFRRDWTRLAQQDADLAAYRQQWDEAKRASGEVPSEEYQAQRRAAQIKCDEVTGGLQRALLRRLLHTLSTSERERWHAASILLFASISVPELRTASFAQDVLEAAGKLQVAAPLWASQKMAEVMAAAKRGTISLDRAFGLTATKGKTLAVKASDMRRRDLALVMAVEQLREQHGMSLEDACERVAETTGQVSPGTLVNTYSRFKQEGWTPKMFMDLCRYLLHHPEQELHAVWRTLGFQLCEQMGLAISPPTLIERNCLSCDTLFTASDRVTRLCPACK